MLNVGTMHAAILAVDKGEALLYLSCTLRPKDMSFECMSHSYAMRCERKFGTLLKMPWCCWRVSLILRLSDSAGRQITSPPKQHYHPILLLLTRQRAMIICMPGCYPRGAADNMARRFSPAHAIYFQLTPCLIAFS